MIVVRNAGKKVPCDCARQGVTYFPQGVVLSLWVMLHGRVLPV
jgi:hypothetical protein